MTTSRDQILARIRTALGPPADHQPPYEHAITRTYRTTHATRTPRERTALLADNLTDYRAHVHHTTPDGLPALIARLLADHGSRTLITPTDLPPHWLSAIPPSDVEIRTDDPHLTHHDLDTTDSVVTGCALAIAETGTIVLDTGPGQGHRRITLIPDHHICVIHAPHQIHDSLPQALLHLDPTHPHTLISGPSATSDIELDRVEGVHGPRTLDAVIVTE
ncbi:L-lactate dehydrogenase complex protein LldG [Actinacidiphila rubida]|uniref:L-lactate dehydrogenase complex protein LldG n=1 Tax=Actinacidiphila rubida TaxID=310780 RepID=A0A1H8I5T9_9ACTN|nr:LUD domain-containing protein [Actinacidiphila rubida]SEN63879.1 L-lactate dehydrogenase complex protein LldG [Actinacidiphila rubida]